MRSLVVGVALICSVGVAHADDLAAKVAALEARVKALEDINAKYREALVFLQQAYQQQKASIDAQNENEPAKDAVFAVQATNSIRQNMWEGSADGAVTIVMAFDYADPYSARTVPILQELSKDYPGKLRIVYKNMVVHPQVATKAHHAGCAASLQRKFPEFMHAFWKEAFDPYVQTRDATNLDASAMVALARKLKLDTKRFESDMNSDVCVKRVSDDMAELANWRVNATPTFFVNGSVIAGAMPKETFKQMIDDKLRIVAASKIAPGAYYEREVIGKGEKKFRSMKDAKP